MDNASHPSRGGWIEIPLLLSTPTAFITHHGVGGLKYLLRKSKPMQLAHPSRVGGLKCTFARVCFLTAGHPSRGGWIEIADAYKVLIGNGPTPHGVGGLKYAILPFLQTHSMSHPSRGGWIEIG